MSFSERVWHERAVEFGPEQSLRGIVTTPTAAPADALSVFIVLLNAGVIHRVGPNRLSVKLARELAAVGLPALRFDLSGLGDSAPRRSTTSIDDGIALDIGEAFEFLSRAYGAERFVMVGLCSGGREAFRAAYRESRVAGAVLIDPYAYATVPFFVRRYGPRLIRGKSWGNVLSGRHRLRRALRARLGTWTTRRSHEPPNTDVCGIPERPSRPAMGDALDRVLARGTELLFVHTGGMPEHYNYRDQLRDAFPKQFAHRRLRYEYLPDADHTFSSEDTRRDLRERLLSWLADVGLMPARPPVAAESSP